MASLARTTAWLALGTATSRVLGLARTILLGIAIGITGSTAADAYAVANKLPNVMFAILAAGVLNAALVPQIVKSFHENRERTVHRILTLGGFWILVITAILTATAGLWVRLYSSGWGPEQTALATAFALWCIPQLFFYGMYTLWGEVLNAREQFGPFMWAPVVNNIIAIVGLLAYLAVFGPYARGDNDHLAEMWTGGRIALIAAVATLGIAAQAFVLLWPMAKGGYRWRWVWSGPQGELVTVAKVASWALAAVLVEQVAVMLTTRVASAAQEVAPGDEAVAGVFAYDYALSIYLVPHSLVTVSILTVLFTAMARAASDKDMPGVRKVLSRGMRLVGAFTMFAATALVILAPHVVRVLAPSASVASVDAVAGVLRIMAVGLVPLGAAVLVKRAFFALEDGRSIFLIHIPMGAVWVAFAYAGQAWLDARWWVPAVAVGLVASNIAAVLLRVAALRKRLDGLDGRRILVMHGKALLAALAAAVVGIALWKVLPASYEQTGTGAVITSVVVIAVSGIAMLGAYVGVSKAVRLAEVDDLVSSLGSKLRRRVR